jgi:hypothetical protein
MPRKSILDWALEYYDAGLCVIPLKPDKRPTLKSWRDYQKTRPTREEVKEWFSSGSPNIGIICGAVSGNLAVVDFDDPAKYEALKNSLPETWITQTGRGYHAYFQSDEPIKSYKLEQDHIDVRAEGTYVVAPPSVHESGKRYKFIARPVRMASAAMLRSLGLSPVESPSISQEREPSWVAKAMSGPVLEGTRDDTCTKLAGHFLRILPRDEVEIILTTWGRTQCDPPFERRMVMKCIESISRKRGVGIEDLVALSLNDIINTDVPEIPELINNWLRVGDITLLVGGGGVGKSTVAMPAAMALSAGVPFIEFGVAKAERALYVDLEMGAYEFRTRAKTLSESYPELARQNFYGLSLSTFRINQEGNLGRLRTLIEKIEPKLLVIDNHARFHTGDPNSERDMQDMIVDPLTSIMADYQLAVLYLMHTPWKEQDRPRGSMSIFDMASTMISVNRGASMPRNRVIKWGKNRPARREERLDSLTIVYDPETFALERGDAAGMSGDVLQNVQWPIGRTALMNVFREQLGIGRDTAFKRIDSLERNGDLVRNDRGQYERPDQGPAATETSSEDDL